MQRGTNGQGTGQNGWGRNVAANAADAQGGGGLGAALAKLTDGFSRLVSDHLALAQAELKRDATAFGREAMKVAAFAPLLMVGYGFLCAALAAGLASVLPLWAALLAVGLLNLLAGLAGTGLALQKLKTRPPVLEESFAQAQRTAQSLAHAAKDPVPVSVMLEGEKRLGP